MCKKCKKTIEILAQLKIKKYLCIAFHESVRRSGCSAVGSAPGLGPGGRPFESGHPDILLKSKKDDATFGKLQ